MIEKVVTIVVFLCMVCIITLILYFGYGFISSVTDNTNNQKVSTTFNTTPNSNIKESPYNEEEYVNEDTSLIKDSNENSYVPPLNNDDFVEYNILNKYGSWNKNIYTNEYLDLKITLPNFWGYFIGEDNTFNITSPGIDESITITILKGDAQQIREADINNRTFKDRYQTFKKSKVVIGEDEYITFTQIIDDEALDPIYNDITYYRNVPNSDYVIKMQTYIKPENINLLGKIFEKNGNTTFNELENSVELTKTQREFWPYEVIAMGKQNGKTYTNEYLGFKIIAPQNWEVFSIGQDEITIKEDNISGTIHNCITIRLYKDFLTHGTIDQEIQHRKDFRKELEEEINESLSDSIEESTEMILGQNCKTIAFVKKEDSIKKYYYINLLDGKYILEIESILDLPSAFQKVVDIDINKVIMPLNAIVDTSNNKPRIKPDNVLLLGKWTKDSTDFNDFTENFYTNVYLNMKITKPSGWRIFTFSDHRCYLKDKNADHLLNINISEGLANLMQEYRKNELLKDESVKEVGEEVVGGYNYYTVTTVRDGIDCIYKDYYRDIESGETLVNIHVEYPENSPLDVNTMIDKMW